MGEKFVIGITGTKGKGKTAFYTVLTYLLSINGYSAIVLNYADYIKQIALECFNREIGRVHGKLSEPNRRLLCAIGDALRNIDPNCLINIVERKIEKLDGFIIIGDARLLPEAELIKKYNGAIVRIDSNVLNRNENYLKEHKTETDVLKIEPDFTVMNDGSFTDLINEGKKVLSFFIKKDWLG